MLWTAQSHSPMVTAVPFTTSMTYATGREQRTERRGSTGVRFFRALIAAGGTAHSLSLALLSYLHSLQYIDTSSSAARVGCSDM